LSNQIIICSCISEFVFASDGFILVATFPAIFQYSFSVIFQYSHSIEHLSENVKSGLSLRHRLDINVYSGNFEVRTAAPSTLPLRYQ